MTTEMCCVRDESERGKAFESENVKDFTFACSRRAQLVLPSPRPLFLLPLRRRGKAQWHQSLDCPSMVRNGQPRVKWKETRFDYCQRQSRVLKSIRVIQSVSIAAALLSLESFVFVHNRSTEQTNCLPVHLYDACETKIDVRSHRTDVLAFPWSFSFLTRTRFWQRFPLVLLLLIHLVDFMTVKSEGWTVNESVLFSGNGLEWICMGDRWSIVPSSSFCVNVCMLHVNAWFLFSSSSLLFYSGCSLSRQKTSEHQAIWIVREGTSDVFNPSVKCNKYYESKKRSGEREMASDRLRQVRRGTTFDCR